MRIRNLEIHVTHLCNLSCQQCTHYSNHKHTGSLTASEADRQMGLWSHRVEPKYFSLLGGEPTLNKELCEIIEVAAKHWSNSKLHLVTNGFFLHKHPRLPEVLKREKVKLSISIHHESHEYLAKIEPVTKLIQEWGISAEWRSSSRRWTRTYLGDGKDMSPFSDNNPKESWNNCRAKWCTQLYDGKLWKCPQIAYLNMQVNKVGADKELWNKYLEYSPLSPECSDIELEEFLTRETEDICSMCPAYPRYFELQNPLQKEKL